MHIRQLRGFLEALFAAAHDLIPFVRDVLDPFKLRFDIDCFLYFLTNTLPLVGSLYSQLSAGLEVIYYSGVCHAFRQVIGNQRPHYTKVYIRQLSNYLYFKRVQHPLAMMGSAALHHNFEFIETNVNSLASAELQNLVTVESGVKKVYKKFAARMNQDVLQFQEDFGDLDTDTVFVNERRMAFMVEEATKLIYNITDRAASKRDRG